VAEKSVSTTCGAVEGPAAIFQARFVLNDEARPEHARGRSVPRKALEGFFSILSGNP